MERERIMKKQLASIELLRVVKELKEQLLLGKINKIYVDIDRAQGTKKELFFECHVPNKGKKMLRVILPAFIFLTTKKPVMPERPDGYCLYLRKYLHNARITEMEQVGIERIIKISLEVRGRQPQTSSFELQAPSSEFPTSNPKPPTVLYNIYIELFSKGNFILTSSDNTILSPLEIQEWSERAIRPKEKYTYPRQEYNSFKMAESDFIKALELSKKGSIVTALALDFSLGGLYAEELCHRVAISKEAKKVTKQQGKKIFAAFQELKKEIETGPAYIVKLQEEVIDIVPCSIEKYKQATCVKKESFLEAMDEILSQGISKEQGIIKTKQEKKLTSLKVMMENQEKQITSMEEEYQRNQKIGTVIYEHYQQLAPLLKQFQDAQKTKTWKEVKKALTDNPLVKQINEQSKEVIVEL